MRLEANLALFAEERPAAMVVSHERSGTHFLMNALAACYGYVSQPFVNLDRPSLNINYFYPPELRDALLTLASRPMANVVKAHYPADFFADELPRVTERYVIFSVCRDPVPTLISYWRILHRWAWVEGPRVADPITFARAEPCGRMMRYQMRQQPNLMRRWAAHVESWLAAARALPRVVVVRYEDLDQRYGETMRGFAGLLGRPPQALTRPARDFNVIAGGPTDPTGSGVPPDTEALRQLCRQEVGATMARLGY
ncbi:MAG TPA: sulfotransferase domain-containing protein [Gemmataceae bacterium]|nr:sulfotransferase domain-containing protein [Gemmataceae bacterium]